MFVEFTVNIKVHSKLDVKILPVSIAIHFLYRVFGQSIIMP